MNWNEDAWDLKHSSTIWWVSTKPAACVRPIEQYWTLGCAESRMSGAASQHHGTDGITYKISTDELPVRNGHWKILSSVVSVWNSGLNLCGFLKLQTIKLARLEWYGLRVLNWEWVIKRFAHCKDLKGRSEKGVAASSDQKPEVCMLWFHTRCVLPHPDHFLQCCLSS